MRLLCKSLTVLDIATSRRRASMCNLKGADPSSNPRLLARGGILLKSLGECWPSLSQKSSTCWLTREFGRGCFGLGRLWDKTWVRAKEVLGLRKGWIENKEKFRFLWEKHCFYPYLMLFIQVFVLTHNMIFPGVPCFLVIWIVLQNVWTACVQK